MCPNCRIFAIKTILKQESHAATNWYRGTSLVDNPVDLFLKQPLSKMLLRSHARQLFGLPGKSASRFGIF